jgi:sugar phosphate isomerase/epimerase
MMRIEISTYYRYFLRPYDAIREIYYKLGFKNQQLFGHKSLLIKEVKNAKEDLGLQFSMHPPVPNPRTPSIDWLCTPQVYRKIILENLDLAHKLEVDFIVIHGRGVNEGGYEKLIKDIRSICEHAQKLDIQVCLENSSFFPRSAEEMLRIYNDVAKENFGLAFDVSHAMVVEKTEERVMKSFRMIQSKVANLHLGELCPEGDLHGLPELDKPFFSQLLAEVRNLKINAITLEPRPDIEDKDIKHCLNELKNLVDQT